MSEPEAGSDVGNLKCKASRDNGSYVISGHKTWISAARCGLALHSSKVRPGEAQHAASPAHWIVARRLHTCPAATRFRPVLIPASKSMVADPPA